MWHYTVVLIVLVVVCMKLRTLNAVEMNLLTDRLENEVLIITGTISNIPMLFMVDTEICRPSRFVDVVPGCAVVVAVALTTGKVSPRRRRAATSYL